MERNVSPLFIPNKILAKIDYKIVKENNEYEKDWNFIWNGRYLSSGFY